jgi:hypothetical protein
MQSQMDQREKKIDKSFSFKARIFSQERRKENIAIRNALIAEYI